MDSFREKIKEEKYIYVHIYIYIHTRLHKTHGGKHNNH